ncbi:MAG: sigma-54-dependent Fis family transcriptional regulator [Acidobacteria bacterium]|nr:sigma-54-dependent Fis family transcriptional regulator [Acidobacteriota bacterium]
MPPRVLIADGDFSFAHSFQEALTAEGIATVLASTAPEATALAKSSLNLYLAFVDAKIPASGGLALMQQLHHVDPSLTVILMSANGTLAAAVEATKRGAEDYIHKPFEFAAVAEKVGRFQELFECRRGVGELTSPTGPIRRLEDFIYCSQTMRGVLDEAKKASRMEVSVLLVGECGVGKDILARAIHAASPRASGSFFRIDCASFAHDLPGRVPFVPDLPASAVSEAALLRMFEATAGGTLLLSEVGELPQDIQDKLVSILDVTRLPKHEDGSSARPAPRVLASTSRSTSELQQKYLRKEFYSRVAEVVLEIPPLRSRPEDVPPLVKYFLGRLGRCYNHQFVLSWSGLDLLLRYSLPGNVRELECILERVAAHLLQIPRRVIDGDLRRFLNESGILQEIVNLDEQPMELSHIEQLAIERALWFAKGNRTRAAALLGIDRTTLYSKLRRLSRGNTAIAISARSGLGTKPKRNPKLEMDVKPGQHPSRP